jgi:hypothetical protein
MACEKDPHPVPNPQPTFSNSFVYDSLERDQRFDSVAIVSTNGLEAYEASGVVQSSIDPDFAWVINDGGNSAELFLVNVKSGRTVTTLELDSLTNTDWEDMAFYQDPTGTNYLLIADIGDNLGLRNSVSVYKFLEPALNEIDTLLSLQHYQPLGFEEISFVYESGPMDAEALLLNPENGELYIITKRTLRNRLYHVDQDSAKAFYKGDFTLYMCTAGDAKIINNDHIEIVVRNYDRMILWEGNIGQSIESIMSQTPKLLPYTYIEEQGESVWFTKENGIGTASETRNGVEGRIAIYKKL